MTKALPAEALDAVAYHGVAVLLRRDDAETRRALFLPRAAEKHEMTRAHRQTRLLRAHEVGTLAEPAIGFQARGYFL